MEFWSVRVVPKYLNCFILSQDLLPIFRLRLVGRDSTAGIATRYGLDGPGIECRWGSRFFPTRPDRPWCPPSLLHNGYQVSLPRLKRQERGVDHPLSPRDKVKEGVELHLYSPSGPSLLTVGWPLPLHYVVISSCTWHVHDHALSFLCIYF